MELKMRKPGGVAWSSGMKSCERLYNIMPYKVVIDPMMIGKAMTRIFSDRTNLEDILV